MARLWHLWSFNECQGRSLPSLASVCNPAQPHPAPDAIMGS